MTVRTTGAMPVAGTTTVRLNTALDGRASGAGWSCGPALRGSRSCAHDGPVPVGGALPELSWELTAPDPLPGPVVAIAPVGGIRATVRAPAGTDADTTNDAATATPLAPAPVEAVVDLVGTWDALVPATTERTGRVSFVVTNTTGAAIPGSVAVRPFGWQGESGDGWRCADTCRYAGPLAAGATLPALRGAVVPAQRSDDSDTVRAVLLRPDGTRVEQYQAVLPAARGPVPTLSLGMGDSTLVQPGVPTTLRGSVAADLPVAGPVALRLDPDPGVVVERVTGATCTTALRCTVAGTSTTGRGISVVVRTATDVAGPLRLRGRLSAEGARQSDSSTVLVPRAAGGDLTSTLDGPPAALPGGAARLVQRIRNDGSETISGPIRAHAGNSDVYREVPGTTAAGWECERLSATCVHDGSLAPGDTLPPLVRTATAGVSTPAPPVVVASSVEAVSDDDTVPENSGASTTVPAGSPASADVAISLAADGAPAPGGPSRFVARVRNVGDRATTAPVEVAFGSSLILPGGVVVPTPIFGGSVSFPDVPADGAPAWGCAVATQRCLLRAPLGPGESAPALPVRRAAPLIGAAPAMQAQAASVTSGSDAARSTTATASAGPLPQSASDVAVAVGTAEPAVRGRTIRHEIRVVNLGTARSVEPVEVEVAAVGGQRATVSGAGWTCPVGGRVCRLTGDVLDAGDAAPPLTAEIEENGSSPDDRGLTATVSGDGDPPAGNDRSTASVLQQRSPDGAEVGVAFDGTTPTPYDGPVRGRLRVAHVGTGAPAGPVVVLLAGVDDAGADGWTCEATATRRQRRCTAADVPAPGAQLPAIDVESRAPADPWTASVVSPGPGRHAAASVVPSVGRPPVDLGIALSGGDPLADGDETTLVATVHNGGSRTTSSATTVLLAAPTTVDLEARGSDWECDAQACTTRREVVPGGRLPELRVRVRPQGRDGARPATIGVGVVHPGDQVAVDDTATATVGVGAGRVDLAPAVSSDGVLRPGLATRTVVRVRNVGAGATDRPTTLDVEAPFGGTLAGEGWTCAELRCRRDGPVLPLADLPPVVLTATTPADAPLDRVTTSASVTNDADGTSTDDRASSSRGVGAPDRTLPRPSAAVDVGLPVPSGAPGDVVPVQVAILGPDVARTTPARTRLTLPEGLSFAGVPAGDPAPASDGRTLTWDLPLPADRAAESWTVLARVDDGATPGARRPSATLTAAPFATPETAAATFVVTAPPEPPAPADGSAGPGPPPAGSTAPGPAAPGPAPSQSDPDAALAAFLAALGRPAPTPPAGLGPGTSRPAAPARPTVRLTTLRPPRTSALTRSGWAVRIRQTGGATARASLVVDRATARRLRVRAGTAVATGRATLRRPGAATVVLRVPAGLRARVRRAARVTGTLEVVVRSASGSARAARRVTVTR
ncbi:unannotated protein [freshwater metagenome]|uniref:Unannotated protein n=1 Tax=freshwater metagenome TaxID=449393 RepID=A0A6J7IEJ7_9ZZZZ